MLPGTPAICRLEDGRQFLWRIYGKLDRNSIHREAYFAHEAVELIEDANARKPIYSNRLLEIYQIQEPIADFEKVTLDVRLDCPRLRVELLLTKDCLCEVLCSLLMTTFFARNTRLDFSFLQDRNMGISAAFVKETDGPSNFGAMGPATRIEIGRIVYHPEITQSIKLKPLGGIDCARKQLEDGVSERISLLISGPSGTGKYSMVKSLATTQNLPLFEIRGLNFVRSLPGETEAELRKIFLRLELFEELTCGETPIILLVKDIDTICPKIGNKKGEDVANVARIASQFVSLVDQYRASMENLIIICTTSMIENLDNRLRRPGRLGREITLGIPSKMQREEMLRCFNSSKKLSEEQLSEMAFRTAGYVGAELELLYCNVAREIPRSNASFENVLAEVQKKHRPSSLRNATGLIGRDVTLSLDSFAGMEKLKSLLRLCIIEQLKDPTRFYRLGINPLKGILLYGPPGCAKTTLTKCLASESGMTFLSLSAAELYSPYVGDAEKLVTRLFNEARANAPAIVFLDEIDSLVGNRGAVGQKGAPAAVNMGILSTLLMEMDGIGQAEQTARALSGDAKRVIVIAATNRPDMVDDALLRPGRLTKLIHVPAPDVDGRVAILKKLGETIPFADDVDVTVIAKETERYSGADLTNLCTQAALVAATEDLAAKTVTMAHFKEAFKDVRPSLTKEQIKLYHNYEANRER
ncbi:ATPase family gene 2 protein homolog B [Anopheles ziemanni]|uniref:ATPase family gene 2 protein homolog B n=1 Tax=Anopheles coustani TaxID=139045 RepID=UPI00265AEC51|nr:ATPase family gene 2 protein homolog B [Anopheles coustani]XP_058128608.1 ATPase family gene 2 protein homolog B [Anopheles coustani]XP_058128616.1 ATPase family gene 2 protein homolog B [Anopheles coustani]XP_058172018.1 ATPase family gene 2 protein homolog B [Anopheles ziemanni]